MKARFIASALLLVADRFSAVPCNSSGVVAPLVVQDTAGAFQLAEAVFCSGGSFDVVWVGSVTVMETIRVVDDTVLTVRGAADRSAVIDGANDTRMFNVSGGTLCLSDLTLVNGNSSDYGGAIYSAYATVVVSNCSFVRNRAKFGGAIFLEQSILTVLGDTIFAANVALDSGGGVYGHFASNVTVDGTAMWEGNSAVFGAGIRLYSACSLTFSDVVTFERNSGDQGSGVWMSDKSTLTALNSSTVIFDSNTAFDCAGLLVYYSSAEFLAGSTVTFSNNTAFAGGGMCVVYSGEANLMGEASFINNTARTGGGIQLREGTKMELGGDALMVGNTATFGAAIYGEATVDQLRISNTRFISNEAGVSGGAITLLSSGTKTLPTKICNCTFEQNRADDAGGAIFIGGGFVDINDAVFAQNVAGRTGGAVLTSGITSVNRSVFSGNQAYVGPAISNTVSLSVGWTEFDGNTLLCDDGHFLDWANMSAYDTACDACPTQECCAGCVESDCCVGCTVRNPYETQLCEVALEKTTSNAADGTLESLDVQEGYWRSSNTSRDIRACYEAASCVGGTDGYCDTGYTGPFCAVCAHGYAGGWGYSCAKCSERRRCIGTAIAVVAALALTVGVVLGLRFISSTSAEEGAQITWPGQSFKRIQSRFQNARTTQALKIVIVSLQIVTQFSTVASITYPEAYEAFLRWIDVVNLNIKWMLSVSCLVKTNFYDSLLLSTIGPLAIGGLLLASYKAAALRCFPDDQEVRLRVDRRHGAAFFWISFFLYTTVSSDIFYAFVCDHLDTGESFLRVDHSLECYTAKHNVFMVYAAFMGFLYPFGVPLCYMYVLYGSRDSLKRAEREDDARVSAFRELWRPYRPEVYFYEVVECLRRVVLSGVVVFVFPNTAGQVATTFLLALFFFGLLMALNPYADPWDMWLARIGHVIVMMSVFVGLLQKVDLAEEDHFSQDVFAGVLVVGNCGMILAVIVEACGLCVTAVKEPRDPVTTSSRGHENEESLEEETVWPTSHGSRLPPPLISMHHSSATLDIQEMVCPHA